MYRRNILKRENKEILLLFYEGYHLPHQKQRNVYCTVSIFNQTINSNFKIIFQEGCKPL